MSERRSSGWGQKFDERIMLPDERMLVTLRCGELHYGVASEGIGRGGVAGRHRGADVGRRPRRPDDVRPHWRYASLKPPPRSPVQSQSERPALGSAQAEERSMTVFAKCALCEDCGWVCENHPDRPWDGKHACNCGGAGAPCPRCNPSDEDDPPRPPRGFSPLSPRASRGSRPGRG